MTAETGQAIGSGAFQWVLEWARRSRIERKLALVIVVLALCSGVVTFGVMTDHLPIAADPQTVLLLLVGDLVLLLGLSALIARRLAVLWAERKRGRAGSRLHVLEEMLGTYLTEAQRGGEGAPAEAAA